MDHVLIRQFLFKLWPHANGDGDENEDATSATMQRRHRQRRHRDGATTATRPRHRPQHNPPTKTPPRRRQRERGWGQRRHDRDRNRSDHTTRTIVRVVQSLLHVCVVLCSYHYTTVRPLAGSRTALLDRYAFFSDSALASSPPTSLTGNPSTFNTLGQRSRQ